jgi:O-acetyl-ADP-ribose deacetylase (regulator of RNase III)
VPTQIEIVQGDITDQDADAIVNAANNELWMGAGVAGAIVRKGGREIEADAIRQGPIRVGEAVITGGGSLIASHVIHAAAMGQDLRPDGESIRKSTDAALTLAEERKLQSIAFPALGTGVGGFSVHECAAIMIDVVRDHADRRDAVATAYFVLFDEPAFQEFRAAAGP